MPQFSVVKNGYDKKEVDTHIEALNAELEIQKGKNRALSKELQDYKAKDRDIKAKGENISIALTAAVEKAKQIEKSSKNVYKLKIQQLGLLYNRWEKLLAAMLEKYPGIDEVDNVKALLADFKSSLKSTLKDDFNLSGITSPVQTDNDTIRLLLAKLNNMNTKAQQVKKEKVERKHLSKDMLDGQTELERIEEKAPLIKPIYDSTIKGDEEYETLADKFLTEKAADNAYANIITSKVKTIPEVNETGFDLKEAINPKQDLDEIMKAFDFFNTED
ncbi:MAG: hypothetical protein IJA69_02715 [Clostridia bacterium]|nr:hypothetical protein [Clostridia bacterium]